VPPGWEHPRDGHGRHIPLFDRNPDPQEAIDEELPDVADRVPAMPGWAPEEASCYQVYENVTEGTPVSPVFDSLDGVRDWLVDQGYSQRAAEGFCRHGQAPTLVLGEGAVYPDIESAALLPDDEEQPP
jgi:hypothetical protein